MRVTFDPPKETKNVRKHGLSLKEAEFLEWDMSLAWEDDRYDYGEMRMIALVPKGSTMYYVAYTDNDDLLRIISMRKANKQEIKFYVSHY